MNEYQLIKDVNYEYDADIGLAYSSPCRGIWNIVHIGTQIPGCHQIYVCPTSCLRGVVLTTAEMHAMDRLSTITVGEDNILEGNMEETLHDGVVTIIMKLPERPKMIMIFISCIHQFMAANYQRVYGILRKEYPDIDFVDAYMDPIMRRKTPAVPSLTRQIYRVLQPADHYAKQVNYIGNWFSTEDYSDLTKHLRTNGIDIRDLSLETDYDHFKQMQNSSLNITFHKYASAAGKDMEIRLQQKWIKVHMGFDYNVFAEDMNHICELLKIPAVSQKEIENRINACESTLKELKKIMGNVPISLDYTAVDEPLNLAYYLLKHDFNVESVFIEVFTEAEKVFNDLRALKPDLKIYSADNWNMRVMDREHKGKVLAIGQKAAYYNDTNNFVDIIWSAGMYGYLGILHLCDLMKDAYLHEKDMMHLVQHKGWGCCAK